MYICIQIMYVCVYGCLFLLTCRIFYTCILIGWPLCIIYHVYTSAIISLYLSSINFHTNITIINSFLYTINMRLNLLDWFHLVFLDQLLIKVLFDGLLEDFLYTNYSKYFAFKVFFFKNGNYWNVVKTHTLTYDTFHQTLKHPKVAQ